MYDRGWYTRLILGRKSRKTVTETAAIAKTGMRVETRAETEELFCVAVPEPALSVSIDDCKDFILAIHSKHLGKF